MRKYEVMYIIRPTVDDEAKKAVIDRFNNVLTSNGAEITGTKDWGKRRLAYEINDFREGFYQIVNVQSDAAAVQEFDRQLRSVTISFATLLLKKKNKSLKYIFKGGLSIC